MELRSYDDDDDDIIIITTMIVDNKKDCKTTVKRVATVYFGDQS